jgi:hypothetical protein
MICRMLRRSLRADTARARLAVPFLIAALTAPTASATEVLPLSIEDLGRQAEQVVQGRVSRLRSYWNPDHTKIFTEVTVNVDRQYKGASLSQVRIVEIGGVVDTVKMTVAGSIIWRTDQEVLLFLEPSLPDRYRVSGFNQGRFAIERDPVSGDSVVKGNRRMQVEALLERALGSQFDRQLERGER